MESLIHTGEPLLARYLGRRVTVEEYTQAGSVLHHGVLGEFSRDWILLLDARIPDTMRLRLREPVGEELKRQAEATF